MTPRSTEVTLRLTEGKDWIAFLGVPTAPRAGLCMYSVRTSKNRIERWRDRWMSNQKNAQMGWIGGHCRPPGAGAPRLQAARTSPTSLICCSQGHSPPDVLKQALRHSHRPRSLPAPLAFPKLFCPGMPRGNSASRCKMNSKSRPDPGCSGVRPVSAGGG